MFTNTVPPQAFESIVDKDSNSLADATQAFEKSTQQAIDEIHEGDCPISVFPAPLKQLVWELASKYKFPVDFSLAYIIYAFSVAIGNTFRVRVKNEWSEPALIYIGVVAPPGGKKTPVQSFFLRPHKMRDQKNYDVYLFKSAQYEELKQAATKENPYNEERPVWAQTLMADTTLEAALEANYHNGRGMGISPDELAGFMQNQNRYTPKGNDSAAWLSIYNTQSFSINRKGRVMLLRCPFVSIAGGIQPKILVKVFSGDMLSNGMIDRFLFVYPENPKKEIATDEEIDQGLIDSYTDAINFLFDVEDEKDEKDTRRLLNFDAEARKLLFEYLQQLADEVNEANDKGDEQIAGMLSKFDYHVIRLSFILQMITEAYTGTLPTSISVESVQGGIKLSNYFKCHSLRVHALIKGNPLAALTEDKQAFYKALPVEFALADAFRIASAFHDGEADTIQKWVNRFLKTDVFTKIKHGFYQKKYS